MPSSKDNTLHSSDHTMHVDNTMLNSTLATDCNTSNPTSCAEEDPMSDDSRINPIHSVPKESGMLLKIDASSYEYTYFFLC